MHKSKIKHVLGSVSNLVELISMFDVLCIELATRCILVLVNFLFEVVHAPEHLREQREIVVRCMPKISSIGSKPQSNDLHKWGDIIIR